MDAWQLSGMKAIEFLVVKPQCVLELSQSAFGQQVTFKWSNAERQRCLLGPLPPTTQMNSGVAACQKNFYSFRSDVPLCISGLQCSVAEGSVICLAVA